MCFTVVSLAELVNTLLGKSCYGPTVARNTPSLASFVDIFGSLTPKHQVTVDLAFYIRKVPEMKKIMIYHEFSPLFTGLFDSSLWEALRGKSHQILRLPRKDSNS